MFLPKRKWSHDLLHKADLLQIKVIFLCLWILWTDVTMKLHLLQSNCVFMCVESTLYTQIITQSRAWGTGLSIMPDMSPTSPLGRKCCLQMWSWDCSFRRTLDEEVFMGITCPDNQNTETSRAKYETGKGAGNCARIWSLCFSYFLAYSSSVIFEYVWQDVFLKFQPY